jgi:hypothetical protein
MIETTGLSILMLENRNIKTPYTGRDLGEIAIIVLDQRIWVPQKVDTFLDRTGIPGLLSQREGSKTLKDLGV